MNNLSVCVEYVFLRSPGQVTVVTGLSEPRASSIWRNVAIHSLSLHTHPPCLSLPHARALSLSIPPSPAPCGTSLVSACTAQGLALSPPTPNPKPWRYLHQVKLVDLAFSPPMPAAPPSPDSPAAEPMGAIPNSGANSSSASTTWAAVGRRRRSPSQQRSMSDRNMRGACSKLACVREHISNTPAQSWRAEACVREHLSNTLATYLLKVGALHRGTSPILPQNRKHPV